jgi:superkiller protein 3
MPGIPEVFDNAVACHAYGCQILAAKGDPTVAEKLFRCAVQIDSGLAGGWQALGVLLLRTAAAQAAQYIEAESCLRRAVALNPTADGYAQLGQAMTYQGRLAEAADTFARAADLAPQQLVVALRAGKAFAEREDYAEARRFFERCLEIDPAGRRRPVPSGWP